MDGTTPLFVQHGSTYYFKNVKENSSLTAHRHKFSNTGVVPGVLTTETFDGEDSQLWDAALVKDGQEPEYWMINHKLAVNELNSYRISTDGVAPAFPSKNFVKLIRAGNCTKIFLIESVLLNKCIQSEGLHQEITYAACDKDSLAQQWTAEFQYQLEKLDEK